MKKKITKDMTFGELMEFDSEAGMKLAEHGLFCGGCPMAQFESIGDGAAAHNVDVVQLLRELNEEGSSSKTKDGSALRDGSHSLNVDGSASLEGCDGS